MEQITGPAEAVDSVIGIDWRRASKPWRLRSSFELTPICANGWRSDYTCMVVGCLIMLGCLHTDNLSEHKT
jgi:hypothetical protein